MTTPDPKKSSLTAAELEAQILTLVKKDKLNQAILLMAKEKAVPQGVARNLVEAIRKRASSR